MIVHLQNGTTAKYPPPSNGIMDFDISQNGDLLIMFKNAFAEFVVAAYAKGEWATVDREMKWDAPPPQS